MAICARNADKLYAASSAAAHGVRASGKALDVSDKAALEAWVAAVAKELGGIDIVIANVSALAIGPVKENSKKSYETDLMRAVRLVNAAMPHLEKSKAAAIVVISSVSGREIDFAAGPYGTFKAALVHYKKKKNAEHRLSARRQEHPCQHCVAGEYVLRERRLRSDQDRQPRTLQDCALT